MEINDLIKSGLEYLKDNRYSNSSIEVRNILADILEKDISYLLVHGEEKVGKKEKDKFFRIMEKRKNGEPLAYILGSAHFYGREFKINKKVLIPRKDTEISIDVLKYIIDKNNIKNLLEIGVGSGIVSVTMGLERSHIDYTGVDVSEEAINNTITNINNYKLENIKIVQSDIYSNINETFDIIYSNPPYIESVEIENLQIEIKDFEPRLALDGGKDGLYFYRKIIKNLDKHLNKNGFLVLEIGYNQKNLITDLLEDYKTYCFKDLSGNDRVLIATKGEINVREFRSI
ncbi:MAG: peptide chain release factor N(5)-glutamine methyltransferase [Peptoniphilaceae bacterium]